jgi:RHS repeat-associated protein
MVRRSSRQSRRSRRFGSRAWLRAAAVVGTVACAVTAAVPANAVTVRAHPGAPSTTLFGYAAGPRQHVGTAAGRRHYVPVSATRARVSPGSIKGHRAPRPHLAPPPVGTPAHVRTGSARMPRGRLVTDHRIAGRAPRPGAPVRGERRPAASGHPAAAQVSGDNASYSVAASFDTVPLADQTGRIAVTLTNTGTTTWSSGYALGSLVFAGSNPTGTGTPLTTGANVAISGTVAPGGSTTVESVTPAENPGSYTICWDMVNAAGMYFSAAGGTEDCASYTIQQYSPVINEQEPLPGTDVNTQTPTLSASAVVPGGYPANPTFSFAFQIVSGTGIGASVVQSSGWVAGNGNSWTPKALTWGNTYYWQVTVSDAATLPSLNASSPWTTPISFVVGDAQPAVFGRLGNAYQADDGNPVMTSDLGGSDYSGSGKTVDPRSGNVSQQVTDAHVATVGPALSIVRTYNSLDPRTSQAFGAGWSSLLDVSLSPDPDGSGALILTMANGQQVRFAKNASGGYAPPQNFYAVVAALSGGGFSVTDQTGITYNFGQASGSSWLLSQVTDGQGLSETFGYSSGQLTTITSNASGRALHLTWTTPSGASYPHVASVATDPVTAGQPGTALTWNYSYNGDLLTSVCPPGTAAACTTYGYNTNGSHAATSVLNAGPTAYYRLNDAAGATTAANQVQADDLSTLDPPAAEFGTTAGVPGPVPGVTATSFNGTSSFIPLDGAWCPTPGQVSACVQVSDSGRVLPGVSGAESLGISVWFKTSTAGGVLLGLTSALPAAQNCSPTCVTTTQTPLLWIGSNGHLQGYGGTVAMSSPGAVNNGAWHQAVVIPGQALYLDGVKVATSTAGFSAPASAYALLGAGLIAQNALYSSWSFFNGSMADLSIYQNDLPSVGTVAAQYAAETNAAAELTTVTSPGGRTEMSATYNTVSDRVSALTDADGGNWTYGSPVSGSSAAGYVSAVMGSAPEDFWPLSDSAGPLARDVVGGAANSASPRPPATYSNVTLGGPGPTGFADGPAASFNGSNSQVAIPGGYFAGTGGESAEVWFKTTATGTLLSSAAGPAGGQPMSLYLASASGGSCLVGSVGNVTVNAPIFGACSAGTSAADGNWHQAVLTVGPSPQIPLQGSSQTATLYLDGKSVGTATISTKPTQSATGYTVNIGNGPHGDFNGSLADASIYTSTLSATTITGHYDALQNQISVTIPNTNPFGGSAQHLATPTINSQTITVTGPTGKNSVYLYADGALAQVTSPLGGVTYYGYDQAQRAATITDPDGDTSFLTYDAHNNVTSTTTCAAVNNCQTSYASYYENPANPLDPRNDRQTDARDARSSSSTDPTYDTVTTYTTTGLVATVATPPTPACPAGCTKTYAYTKGTEPAVGGGTEPAGLVASITAPGGAVTSYAYNSAGDVAQVTDPLGLVTKYTYDNLGRELTETQISGTYPAGLTTSFSYDGLGRTLTETDPPVTDRVTGAVHTKVTTYTYDPDSDILTTKISDATGGDPSRTTTDTYTAHGQLATTTDPLGNVTSYTYDSFGNMATRTNPAGQTTAYAYDAAGDLLTTTLQGYTGNPASPIAPENLVEESRAYDPAGRLASVTNAVGTTTDYTYFDNNQLATSYVPAPGTSTPMANVTTYGYDAAGNPTSQTGPGGLVTNAAYNADNQPVTQTRDPSGADRVTSATYDAAGNVTSESLTGGGVTQTETMTYNALGQQLSETIDMPGGNGANLTTSVVRDQRGLVTSQTDPNGKTATFTNDEAGRAVVETSPAVPSQTGNGAAPVTANPVTMIGYDTFGDETEYSDADGNVTTSAYDGDGHMVSVTDPSYTPPGSTTPVHGTTTMTYDKLGRQASVTDPLGHTTTMTYDQLGDLASQTDPGGGVWTYGYDQAGEQTSVIGPTGAQTQATYDNLGRMVTSTDLVRQNTSAAYTTTFGYDAAGDQVSQTSPTGVTTTAAYDALGERISSTDGAGNTTTFGYNLDGQLTKITEPDGTATTATYDLAGREISQSDLSATGTVLRTATIGYDADGNVTSATDYLGHTTTASYNALGELTSQTVPTSASHAITTTYGYDLNGNQTAQTDGNGNTTYTTYNSLGQPATTVEPAAGSYTSAANSTTTYGYDGDGNLITETDPGGVQITDSYDARGDLTSQSGSGAGAPTATRTFTYDAAGRVLAAATSTAGTSGTFGYQPATSESFTYDDRGLLLSATGSAGTSSFGYNGSGQLTSATDAAGTSSYTYDSTGRLATDSDAASGATGSYAYNSLGQVTKISYGTGNDTQTFGYDGLHRLTSETVNGPSGAQVASIGYGYDANNDVTSMTTSGLAAANGSGTVTNAYGYDQAGRLTSWTATPSGGHATTSTYGYDDNGNLTNDNGVTHSFDARNELTSDGTSTYSYSANGDLVSKTGSSGTTSYTTDAYGQQVTDGPSSYTWDALDRLIGAAPKSGTGTMALTYDGMTDELSSDSSATYSRDPSGRITGVHITAGGSTLALVDEHGDLSGTFGPAGSAMTSSTTYDPWGDVIAASGPTPEVGYQGQWTDPATGQTDMGARFYSPTTGGFQNSDTSPVADGSTASGNDYAYADDNPMSVTDPTGHSPSDGSSGGNVTKADVDAAAARAAHDAQIASQAESAASNAEAVASRAASTAAAAHRLAQELNSDANRILAQANAMSKKATALYNQAQAQLAVANMWLNRANALRNFINALGGPWWCLPCKAVQKGVALLDGPLINAYMANYQSAENAYETDLEESQQAQQAADTLYQNYAQMHAQAVAAGDKADADSRLAAQDAATARYLAGVAANDEQMAAEAEAYYQHLAKEYAAEQHKAKSVKSNKKTTKAKPKPKSQSHGCGGILSCISNCVQHAADCVTHVVTTTIKNTVTSTARNLKACAIDWSPGACFQSAATIALVFGTGGEGDVALTLLDKIATSAPEKLLGELADDALAKGPLGPLSSTGVLTETIEETNEFTIQVLHGTENIGGELKMIATHTGTETAVNSPIGYSELYGPSSADPVACALMSFGCGTAIVGKLIQNWRNKA